MTGCFFRVGPGSLLRHKPNAFFVPCYACEVIECVSFFNNIFVVYSHYFQTFRAWRELSPVVTFVGKRSSEILCTTLCWFNLYYLSCHANNRKKIVLYGSNDLNIIAKRRKWHTGHWSFI